MGDWTLILARDERVSFTPQSVARALAGLDQANLDERERAIMLFTLGAAGAVDERPLLQSWASEGSFSERSAAILALGELGPSASGFLKPLALGGTYGGPQPEVLRLRECALLALLRTGREEARDTISDLVEGAADSNEPLATTATELLVFSINPAGSAEQRAVRRLLELRWDAARRFGLIDGQSWSSRLLEALAEDEEFLDALILEGAAGLGRAGVRDHLLQSLLEGRGAARLRAAVRAMPLELNRLVELDLWSPADAGEWEVLVSEIGLRGLDPLCGPLLERASLVEGVAPMAAGLLVRSGLEPALIIITDSLTSPRAAERREACLALALAGAAGQAHLLRPLMDDSSVGVRGAAIAAGVRLGDREAPLFLRAALQDGQRREVEACLLPMARPGGAMLAVPLLEDWRAESAGEPGAVADGLLHAVLLSAGRSSAREDLRESLRGGVPPGRVGTTMLRVLAHQPTHEDLALMEHLFPLEGRFEDNRILALTLLEAGSGSVLPLVRQALWRTPWNRSVLAGALLAEVAGERALLEEAQSPPIYAGARDARRVGFAVGAWGGVEDVHRLERLLRRGSGDPTLQGAFLGAMAARTQ